MPKYMKYMGRKEVENMVLATQSTIALLCPECGEIEYKALSLFAFNSSSKEEFICQCGARLLTVASSNHRHFTITFQCAFCGNVHYKRISRNALWGSDILRLTCAEVDGEVGFIGPKAKVTQAWLEERDSSRVLYEETEAELEEYENAEAMLAVLDHLHDLARRDGLECSCGNNRLSYDLLTDRIEIYCESCEAVGIIYADSKENVRKIQGMEFLTLEENKTCCFNHPSSGSGLHLAKTIKEE